MTLSIGIFSFTIGIITVYQISLRRFNRRYPPGFEAFPSFSSALLVRLIEALFRLMGWIMILAGSFLIWVKYFIS